MTKKPQTMTFEQWCEELNREGAKLPWRWPDVIEDTGTECWREPYDSGLSPAEAMQEDSFYWD